MSVKQLFEILSASGKREMCLFGSLREVDGCAEGALAMAYRMSLIL